MAKDGFKLGQMRPRWPKMVPSWIKLGLSCGQVGPSCSRWGQVGTKLTTSWAQLAPKMLWDMLSEAMFLKM
eukprot:9168957-Karenia_brevis.AAC.1